MNNDIIFSTEQKAGFSRMTIWLQTGFKPTTTPKLLLNHQSYQTFLNCISSRPESTGLD